MQKTRIMLGLWVTFKTRLDHLQDLEREYEHDSKSELGLALK
jgi:hypothetical protein